MGAPLTGLSVLQGLFPIYALCLGGARVGREGSCFLRVGRGWCFVCLIPLTAYQLPLSSGFFRVVQRGACGACWCSGGPMSFGRPCGCPFAGGFFRAWFPAVQFWCLRALTPYPLPCKQNVKKKKKKKTSPADELSGGVGSRPDLEGGTSGLGGRDIPSTVAGVQFCQGIGSLRRLAWPPLPSPTNHEGALCTAGTSTVNPAP